MTTATLTQFSYPPLSPQRQLATTQHSLSEGTSTKEAFANGTISPHLNYISNGFRYHVPLNCNWSKPPIDPKGIRPKFRSVAFKTWSVGNARNLRDFRTNGFIGHNSCLAGTHFNTLPARNALYNRNGATKSNSSYFLLDENRNPRPAFNSNTMPLSSNGQKRRKAKSQSPVRNLKIKIAEDRHSISDEKCRTPTHRKFSSLLPAFFGSFASLTSLETNNNNLPSPPIKQAITRGSNRVLEMLNSSFSSSENEAAGDCFSAEEYQRFQKKAATHVDRFTQCMPDKNGNNMPKQKQLSYDQSIAIETIMNRACSDLQHFIDLSNNCALVSKRLSWTEMDYNRNEIRRSHFRTRKPSSLKDFASTEEAYEYLKEEMVNLRIQDLEILHTLRILHDDVQKLKAFYGLGTTNDDKNNIFNVPVPLCLQVEGFA